MNFLSRKKTLTLFLLYLGDVVIVNGRQRHFKPVDTVQI